MDKTSWYRVPLSLSSELRKHLKCQFCKVKTIAVKDDSTLFCGKLMEAMCFDYHYHVFKVTMHPDGFVRVFYINELCYSNHLMFR